MRLVPLVLLSWSLAGCDQVIASGAEVSAPLPARTATVGLLADAQYCDCAPEADRYHRASLWKLEEAAEAINREETDFSVHLGDLIDRDAGSVRPALDALAGLEAPLLHVLGNHDFHVAEADRESMPSLLGMEARYYDRTEGLWRFVFLDGTDLSLFATAPGTSRRVESEAMYDSLVAAGGRELDWNGGVGREQLVWLRATLEDALARGQRVAIFSHFPVYPASTHNLWNDGEVLAALEPFPNVVAHLSGHDHGGRSEVHNGVLHVGLEGLVQTRSQNAYAVAHFGVDALEIQGGGRVESRVVPYATPAPDVRRERRQRRIRTVAR